MNTQNIIGLHKIQFLGEVGEGGEGGEGGEAQTRQWPGRP
jgi:hypothetical protein